MSSQKSVVEPAITTKRETEIPRNTPPRIVGIGTSAGGLEALEAFFKNVPPNTGLAFVVIQHLDPTHKGMLAELLQRTTPIPVQQIEDRTRAKANHIYVIPPNADLSILHGVLHLLEPAATQGLRLPIDSFFRALATDQRELGIGVILSGMGSDGSLGLSAIKEQGGVSFVQAPSSAKFDSMPKSAIDAGLADVVAAIDELAGKILAYCQHRPYQSVTIESELPDKAQSELEKVVLILRTQTGHDFSLYKKSTIYRRIERRMSLHQLPQIADYVRYLRQAPQETQMLFKELLIGVTNFFRDPDVWEQLKSEVFPALFAAHAKGGVLRAWVPACATGEEAYSLAIVFSEALAQYRVSTPGANFGLQVFATDLDADAIERARTGAYPEGISANVSDIRLSQFFVAEERGYRVSKEIREMVIFAPQNLVMDPPFTKLDLLSCRNLLIYLETDLQKKLIPLFHYSLNPKGILILGNSETIGTATRLFSALPGKNRLYQRISNAQHMPALELPVSHKLARQPLIDTVAPQSQASETSFSSIQTHTDALLLQRFAPAAVLTTTTGDLVYVSGKTGKYLEPAAGKANLNLFAMARDGLAGPLHASFARSVREGVTHTIKGITLTNSGSNALVDVTIQPLTEPATLQGMVLVVFADTPLPAKKPRSNSAKNGAQSEHIAALDNELKQAHEELQTTREEMQTSQEELKSVNEELQSINEELQSTNEELTTSKEEMQSINEELQTVNHELSAKVDELSQASDDMKNLLNSTDIATLFLDDQLRVRRFTTYTASIIKLIPGDAGRPITDLASELDYPTLADDAREVLRSLVFKEREVPARDGRWFAVRIKPYRTQNNRIDGVVITFFDITTTKTLEFKLREALTVLQNHTAEQDTQLDSAKALETILQQAQAILKHEFAEQAQVLEQSRATLQAQKGSAP